MKLLDIKSSLYLKVFCWDFGTNYKEAYSPMITTIIFWYLISLVSKGLEMHLIDVVTMYLYGIFDINVYINIPEGFKLQYTKPKSMFLIELRRFLYWLKQFGQMWYNHPREYLLKERYVKNHICLCNSLWNLILNS